MRNLSKGRKTWVQRTKGENSLTDRGVTTGPFKHSQEVMGKIWKGLPLPRVFSIGIDLEG